MSEPPPYGPNLQPDLDRMVTCPACQTASFGSTDCGLCDGARLVRKGTRDRYLVEQQLRRPIAGPDADGSDRYDVP